MSWDPRTWWAIDPAVNTTALKAAWSVRLWIWTGLVWGVATLSQRTINLEVFLAWLGGLSAFSGLSYAQYKAQRTTDYGYIERNATTPTPAAKP